MFQSSVVTSRNGHPFVIGIAQDVRLLQGHCADTEFLQLRRSVPEEATIL